MTRFNPADENLQRCYDEVASAAEKTFADLRPALSTKYKFREHEANAAIGMGAIAAGVKLSIQHYDLSQTHITLLQQIIYKAIGDYLVGAGCIKEDEND
jgi:hypothetical protein